MWTPCGPVRSGVRPRGHNSRFFMAFWCHETCCWLISVYRGQAAVTEYTKQWNDSLGRVGETKNREAPLEYQGLNINILAPIDKLHKQAVKCALLWSLWSRCGRDRYPNMSLDNVIKSSRNHLSILTQACVFQALIKLNCSQLVQLWFFFL